jgi:hypothetical protein
MLEFQGRRSYATASGLALPDPVLRNCALQILLTPTSVTRSTNPVE